MNQSAVKIEQPFCDRCGYADCGAPVFVIYSDAMALRVGFRCALEAYALTLMAAPAAGKIEIGLIQ